MRTSLVVFSCIVLGCSSPSEQTPGDASVSTDTTAQSDTAKDVAVTDTTPSACGGTLIPEDQIARATIALNSCLSDDGPWRTQNYLRGTRGGYGYPGGATVVACLAAVTNGCKGVLDCFGISTRTTETCGACDGSRAVLCGDGNFLWDCAKYGGTCSGGRCSWPGSPFCDSATFKDKCDATGAPVSCDDVEHKGPACPSLGLTCGPVDTRVGCVGTGEACTSTPDSYFAFVEKGTACEGDKIDACINGKKAKLPCGCLGDKFTCQTSGTAIFCGAGNECDPETAMPSCDGTKAVFCNAGKRVSIDCTALGFTSCNPSKIPCKA
jgi:hypothetical protein